MNIQPRPEKQRSVKKVKRRRAEGAHSYSFPIPALNVHCAHENNANVSDPKAFESPSSLYEVLT